MVYPTVNGLPPFLFTLRFLGVAVVLFIPTFLMGGTLPIWFAAFTQKSGELGGRVSQLVLGQYSRSGSRTLISGFILASHVGLRFTISCAVAMISSRD